MRRPTLHLGSRVAYRARRLTFAALALITLAVACATSAKDDEIDFISLACAPGSFVDCKCADGAGRGIQICTSDGTGYGDCEQCTGFGTCTTYPNCKGCFDCLETCMCQDGARHPTECQKRCN